MKRFLLILALWLSIVVGAMAQTATKPVGSGTEADPFQITTLDNLYWLSQTPDIRGTSPSHYYFIQTADIDASSTKDWDSGHGFPPINIGSQNTPIQYDAQGHSITKLYVNRPSQSNVGLFGNTSYCTIKGLTLISPTIIGGEYVGSIVGYAWAGGISGCKAVDGSVTGAQNTGGLVGQLTNSCTLAYCYATGTVKASGPNTGGLVGKTYFSDVRNCYSTASVAGTTEVGGLTGGFNVNAGGPGAIDKCYIAGAVTGSSNLGGLVGCFCYPYMKGQITNSYYDKEVTKQSDDKGIPMTTADMKKRSTYAGWDFLGETTSSNSYIWAFLANGNNGYPTILHISQLTISAPTVTTTKEYDGSTTATITAPGEVSGIVGSDDVRVIANAQFNDANASPNKTITVTYTLEGTSKSLYLAPAPRTLTGEIKPKEILVTASPAQKTYGDDDPDIQYTTEPSISYTLITGSLSRAEGTNVGSYRITLGNLCPTTSNYKLTLANEEYFKIVPKQLFMNIPPVIEKVYDGTTKVITPPSIGGIIPGDDASVEVTANYYDKNVGTGRTVNVNLAISGAQAGNYTLPVTFPIYTAVITPASLTVTPNNIEKKVAQAYNFAGTEFTSKGLFEGDELTSVTLTSDGAAASAAINTYNIAASNAQGTGLANYSISYNTGTLTVIDIAPAAPTAVASTAGDEQATVSFTPPTDNGGSPITSYTVTATPGGITATGTASPIVVPGLTNGTAYTFTVTASNSAGIGYASAPSTAVTPVYKPDVLVVSNNMYDEKQAAAQLIKDLSDRYDVTVSTTGVPAFPYSYAQIYDVRASEAITDNDLNQYYLFLREAKGKSVFVAGERHDVTIFDTRNQSISKLIEKLGGGSIAPPSKVSYDAVLLKIPFNTGASSISTVKLSAPGIVTSSGTGSFIATEANGTSGAGIYFPQGTLALAPEGCLVVMYDINFTYYNDESDQKAFRANLEQVMAAGGTLPSPTASSTSLSATPSPAALSAPATLTATVTSGITGEVQFVDVTKDGTKDVTTILGTATLDKGVATVTTSTLALGTHTITAQYTGDADHNASTSGTLKLFIYTAPDAPTIRAATAGDGKATISFTPPAYDGGSPITRYTVTATPEGTGKSATVTVPATGITPGIEHSLEVTGLTNGTRYTFTVTASNAGLTSAPSAPVTTPIRLIHQPEITWNMSTTITYGTPLDEKLLNATADVPGTFSYSPELGTVLDPCNGKTIYARFTPTDDNANLIVYAVKSIDVIKATPAISWNPQTIAYGTALGEAQLGAAAMHNGAVVPGTLTYTANGNTLNVGDMLAAGDHPIKVAFVPSTYYARNYNNVEATATLTVQKATPTIKWDAPAAINYGTPVGNTQLAAIASHNGATVPGTLTYTTEGKALKSGDMLAAGEHPLKVTYTPADAANYNSVEATVSLTVAKAPLTVTASSHSITKGEVIPTSSISYSGFVNGENEAVLDVKPTVTASATDASNAGIYDIVAANGADGNYEFTYVNGKLTINKITPTISWVEPTTITYGTKLGNAQLSATADAEGTFTYTPAAGTVLNAGQGQALSVTFTPTDRVNYNEVAKTVAITVAKAPLTVTASSHTITKGEAIPALSVTYDGFVNGENEGVLDTKPVVTTTATATSPVGEYATVAAGGTDSNYELTYVDGKLAILDKRIPTVSWTEPNGITYGAALSDAQLNATASYSTEAVAGTFTYTPAAGTTLAAGKHELKVTFTPTDGDHYISVEKAVSITVAKAPLTATASSYSVREGEAIPALGITYKGFVNGEDESVLDTKPTATTTATATSPTGVYTITVAGGTDDCYEFAYVDGKFTVSNPIVVSALKAPQPACEGDKMSLAYTLTSGKPTEYQIVFDAKALTAGFSNSGYAALPAGSGTVSISIPSKVADGTYSASLQLRDGYGNISEPTAFQVTVNVSADVIVPKFGNVVLIDNHDGRFTGYQWYRNGSAIGGATNQFYKDPNGLSGTYYAQLKTATGQTVNTCSKVLSIKKSASASVSVYPNPARAGQELTVKLSGFGDEEMQGAVLSVYSTQGIPVLTSRKVEQENRITLSGTDGVYMGRITTADGQVLTFKVVLAN